MSKLENTNSVIKWLKNLGFQEEMSGGYSKIFETEDNGEVIVVAEVKFL